MNKLILLTSVAILCFESISESRAACESGQKQCGNACISDNASCYSCGDDCHAYLTDDTEKTGGFKLNVEGSGNMNDYNYWRNNNHAPWFDDPNWTNITNLEVKGLNSVGNYAFAQLYNVKKLKIDDTISSVGNSSFSSMEKVEGELKIPSSLKTIGQSAFSRMLNITKLDLSEANPTSVGYWAFQQLSNVQDLEIPATFPADVFSSTGKGGKLTINSPIIPNDSFDDRSQSELIIGDTVTSIGDRAFYRLKLTGSGTITIPDSVENIGENAFSGCDAKELKIENPSIQVSANSFSMSKLKNLIVPSDMDFSTFDKSAFAWVQSGLTITCLGNVEDCKNNWTNYCSGPSSGYYFCQNNKFQSVTEDQCNSKNYYWTGSSCEREPNVDKRVCDHEISGYVKVGNYCVSPENSYAKKHYTPAEANQWLRDGNDNFVVLTFKK